MYIEASFKGFQRKTQMKNLNKDIIGKSRYYIEPNGVFGWIFRKEGSDRVIKRDKFKQLLLVFAESYCSKDEAELLICDDNGMLQDIVNFTNGVSRSLGNLQ
jgi:hypothetical protein